MDTESSPYLKKRKNALLIGWAFPMLYQIAKRAENRLPSRLLSLLRVMAVVAPIGGTLIASFYTVAAAVHPDAVDDE